MRYFPSICFGLILREVAIHTLQVLRESRRRCREFLGTPKSYAIGANPQRNHANDDGPIAQFIRGVSAIRVLRSRKNATRLAEPPERPRRLQPSELSPTRSLGLPELLILRVEVTRISMGNLNCGGRTCFSIQNRKRFEVGGARKEVEGLEVS